MLSRSVASLLVEGRCPDCAEPSAFVEGPHGGLSINIACRACGAEFTFCPFAPTLSHRTGEPWLPDRERLRSVFGIELADPWAPRD